MTHVVVVGDALVDRDWAGPATRLCPDSAAPIVDVDDTTTRPGGAALAAVAAATRGGKATLVTAIGADEPGTWLVEELHRRGVEVVDLGLAGPTPEKIRVRSAGATVARVDRGCRPVAEPGDWTAAASAALRAADAILLADYGRGVLDRVPSGSFGVPRTVPVVWDPHPCGRRPGVRIDVATPSLGEAEVLAGRLVPDLATPTPNSLAALLAAQWGHPVVVTCGASGAVLYDGGSTGHIPARPVDGDPCGAGDWFAAGLAVALAERDDLLSAVGVASASAREWVARSGRTPTLVATSGCFDVLHVGHLALLEHARRLGDRLVVLVNSDESVRRLKGAGRPVNRQDDRVALLAGLGCVDEVRLFDELTPCAALEQLRPEVFVKGADYRDTVLPEAEVMARWGGRIELAPLVADRSTTRVLRLAQRLVG